MPTAAIISTKPTAARTAAAIKALELVGGPRPAARLAPAPAHARTPNEISANPRIRHGRGQDVIELTMISRCACAVETMTCPRS